MKNLEKRILFVLIFVLLAINYIFALQNSEIKCSSNSQCGRNTFIGNYYCSGKNVTRGYLGFECKNPGTNESYCTNYTIQKTTKICSETCTNGECQDKCNVNTDCGISGSTGDSFCLFDDVYQLSINYVCNDPDTENSKCSSYFSLDLIEDCGQNAVCTKGTCRKIACYNNSQCGTNSYYGELICNGNNVTRKYLIYECEKPGTIDSFCINYTRSRLNKTCSKGESCINGGCIKTCFDDDKDGYDTCNPGQSGDDGLSADCNDTDPNKRQYLEGYLDTDRDGYGSRALLQVCSGENLPSGYVTKSGDCNDENKNVWQNLSGYIDADGDGYGSGKLLQVCSGENLSTGYSKIIGDCNDANTNIHPGVTEICNGMDDNCDGQIDENNGNCGVTKECVQGKCLNIKCFEDKDCGDVEYLSDEFCLQGNVFNTVVRPKCNNPGRAKSSCANSTEVRLKTECLDTQTCSSGQCIDKINCKKNSDCGLNKYLGNVRCDGKNILKDYFIYECKYPGTVDSYCINYTTSKINNTCEDSCSYGQCTIGNVTCFLNSHCGVSHPIEDYCKGNNVTRRYLMYQCKNPGTNQSYCTNYTESRLNKTCSGIQICSNGGCVKIACNIDIDCGSETFTSGLYCNNGDVYQNSIVFKCNNNGTLLSFCTNSTKITKTDCTEKQICQNGMCINIACRINLDCGTDGFVGDPFILDGKKYKDMTVMYAIILEPYSADV